MTKVPMLTITDPVSGSSVSDGFTVSGHCDSPHQVTVTIVEAHIEHHATPDSNGDWITDPFNNVPSGIYTIRATCGDPPAHTHVDDITVNAK